jgi:Leucine-rich repeat (LRR) protein
MNVTNITQFYRNDSITNPNEIQLRQIVTNWLNDQEATGNKGKAARLIWDTFYGRSTELNLYDLNLNSIPEDALALLPFLKRLDLSKNPLPSFSLSNLSALETLAINNCQFSQLNLSNLPALRYLSAHDNHLEQVALSSMPALETLLLYSNQLTNIALSDCPMLNNCNLMYNHLEQITLSSMPALKELFLSNNRLISIILSDLPMLKECDFNRNKLENLNLSNLPALCSLNLMHNPHLDSLPLELSGYASLSSIEIYKTSIPSQMRQVILDATHSLRNKNRFSILLNLWIYYAGLSGNHLNPVLQLTEQEQIQVTEWLNRLAKAKDFQTQRQQLAQIVCNILNSVLDETFRELFITQITINNTDCEDRASMALNELYVSWVILCGLEHQSLSEKLKILMQAARTLSLREKLSEILDKNKARHDLKESVEIYLYYEIKLTNELDLLTAVRSIRYSAIGQRNWIDSELDQLKANTLSRAPYMAIKLPIFEKLINQDLSFKAELDTGSDAFSVKIEQIRESTALQEGVVLRKIEDLLRKKDQTLQRKKIAWLEEYSQKQI